MQQIQAGKIAAKWGKMAQGPPNALIGYPNGLKALIPHFTSQYPILQVNTPFYTVFQSLFCSKWSKFEREKMIKNEKNGSISPYRAFKAPPML